MPATLIDNNSLFIPPNFLSTSFPSQSLFFTCLIMPATPETQSPASSVEIITAPQGANGGGRAPTSNIFHGFKFLFTTLPGNRRKPAVFNAAADAYQHLLE